MPRQSRELVLRHDALAGLLEDSLPYIEKARDIAPRRGLQRRAITTHLRTCRDLLSAKKHWEGF